jgi:hypothetical protein
MSTPDNGKEIRKNVNPTLNWLKSEQALNLFAVVDQGGNGNYANINDAVDSGAEYIFVKPGEYTLTGDVELNGQSIIGMSTKDVVIKVGAGTAFKLNEADSYNTGTVDPGDDTTEVVGVGTGWSGDPSGYDEPWIRIDGRFLPVDSIDDDTHLQVKARMYSETGAGQNYQLIDLKSLGQVLTGFTLQYDGAGAHGIPLLEINGYGVKVENCYFIGHYDYVPQTIYLSEQSSFCSIKDCWVYSGVVGIEVDNSEGNNIIENNITDQVTNNIKITSADTSIGQSNSIHVLRNTIAGCNDDALLVEDGVCGLVIDGNVFSGYENSGIKIDVKAVGGERIWITNNQLKENEGIGGYQIELRKNGVDIKHVWIKNNYFGGGNVGLNRVLYGDISYNTWADDGWLTAISGDSGYLRVVGNVFSGEGRIYCDADNDYVNVSNNIIHYGISEAAIYVTASDASVVGNVIRNCEIRGVQCASGRAIVEGNVIQNSGGHGIVVSGGNQIVNANVIYGADYNGINIFNSKVTVTNNVIEDVASVGAEYAGVKVNGGYDYLVLSNNRIKNINGRVAVRIDDVDNNAEVVVNGNEITEDYLHAVEVRDCTGLVVSNNMIGAGGANSAIIVNSEALSDGVISGNIIESPGNDGIELTNASRRVVIADNLINSASRDGIRMGGAGANADLVAVGNVIKDAGSIGIRVSDQGYGIVSANNIDGATGDGIQVSSVAFVISDNMIDGCGGVGIDSNAGYHVINGNQVHGCTGDGINASGNNSVVTSNICQDNSTEIVISGTGSRAANNIT